MVTTYWTGLLPSSQASWTLSYSQSVKSTLLRAQFIHDSLTASGKSQTSPALLSWPMVTTYWTGLLPSSQVSWTLPYSQSVKSTLLRAQCINNSFSVTSDTHQMSGFPFHQMVTSLVTLTRFSSSGSTCCCHHWYAILWYIPKPFWKPFINTL